ncbi:hypothetical protein ACF3OH_02010 [Chryseomicrobium aureum]|uniref:hypothetical protein n=1 Tax=Chryseomicrobium aureum TaxID=1441723 RepID=UPI00370D0C91
MTKATQICNLASIRTILATKTPVSAMKASIRLSTATNISNPASIPTILASKTPVPATKELFHWRRIENTHSNPFIHGNLL